MAEFESLIPPRVSSEGPILTGPPSDGGEPDLADDREGAEQVDPAPERSESDADVEAELAEVLDVEADTEGDGDGEHDSDEQGDAEADFERRVQLRLTVARYRHAARRATFTPRELQALATIDSQAAVWVPVATFAVTAVSALVLVLLAAQVGGDPAAGPTSDMAVVAMTIALFVAGFGTVGRGQKYFEARRPIGRLARTDVADAYETVRDAPAVMVDLGVRPDVLSRVADMLPQAEICLDLVLAHEATGQVASEHPAYDQLLLMGAEVTVLTDLVEVRTGRRSSRRQDRPDGATRGEPEATAIAEPFRSLIDVATGLTRAPDIGGKNP